MEISANKVLKSLIRITGKDLFQIIEKSKSQTVQFEDVKNESDIISIGQMLNNLKEKTINELKLIVENIESKGYYLLKVGNFNELNNPNFIDNSEVISLVVKKLKKSQFAIFFIKLSQPM